MTCGCCRASVAQTDHTSPISSFDLKNSNVNDRYLEDLNTDRLPDVVLVKKVYADKTIRNRKRRWRLKHMDGLHTGSVGNANSQVGDEYTAFLEDLEEDADLRKNVNVWKDPRKDKNSAEETDSEAGDVPHIRLAEMLDEMTIGNDAIGDDMAE